MRLVRSHGAMFTAAVFGVGLVAVVWLFTDAEIRWGPIVFLFSGRVFAQRGIVTGGALDQPSLTKGYFIFCIYSLIFGMLVFAVRWIGDRSRQSVRRTLLGLSLLAFLQPLSVLTITFYDLIRYIHAMGFTRARIEGLVFGVSGYAAVFAFIAWASGMLRLWPRKLRWTRDARGFEVSKVRDRSAS